MTTQLIILDFNFQGSYRCDSSLIIIQNVLYLFFNPRLYNIIYCVMPGVEMYPIQTIWHMYTNIHRQYIGISLHDSYYLENKGRKSCYLSVKFACRSDKYRVDEKITMMVGVVLTYFVRSRVAIIGIIFFIAVIHKIFKTIAIILAGREIPLLMPTLFCFVYMFMLVVTLFYSVPYIVLWLHFSQRTSPETR